MCVCGEEGRLRTFECGGLVVLRDRKKGQWFPLLGNGFPDPSFARILHVELARLVCMPCSVVIDIATIFYCFYAGEVRVDEA